MDKRDSKALLIEPVPLSKYSELLLTVLFFFNAWELMAYTFFFQR